MPGFEDSRGGCIDLINACFIKNIIETASSVKIVFVVGQDEITAGRGKKFLKSYEEYKRLIENSTSIENSSVLVISKSINKNKSELLKYLSTKVKPSDLDGFRKWIDKERILPFSNKLETDEKLCIFQAIGDLEPITRAKVNIRSIFASDVKNQVKLIIENEFNDFFAKCHVSLMNLQNSYDEIDEQIKYFSSGFESRIDGLINSSELLKILESLSRELVSCEYYAFEGKIQKIKYKSLQKLKLLKALKHNEEYILQENKFKHELENKIEYLEKRCASLEADNHIKELIINKLESKNEMIEKSTQEDISSLEKEIKVLQQENKSYISEVSTLSNENNTLLSQTKGKSDISSEKVNQIEAMKMLITSHERIINDIRTEKNILQNAMEIATKSNKKDFEELENKRKIFKKSAKSEIKILNQKIIKMEKENKSLLSLNNSLKQEIDNLQKEKESNNSEISNLKSEIQSLANDRDQKHIALKLIGDEIGVNRDGLYGIICTHLPAEYCHNPGSRCIIQ